MPDPSGPDPLPARIDPLGELVDQVPLLKLHTSDDVVVRGVARVAAESGLEIVPMGQDPERDPVVVVVDLDTPEALETIVSYRLDLPHALIVGHIAAPDRERWEAAELAGCDTVANRGALSRQLRQRLERPGALRGRQRFPLCDAADLAGRLDLVLRLPESPLGPIALWNTNGTLRCVGDSCPHAGACLSEGEVEEGVVTCPAHGSQFDLRSGERVRGPADMGVPTYDVIIEEGRAWVVWA